MMQNIELIATATFGLEAVVAQEIEDLGYENIKVENGRVVYAADMKAICRSNLWLRSADRVRLKVGEFKATTFDELFENTKALPWTEILPANAAFPVDGKSVKSVLYSISDCQAIVKKAVVESMRTSFNKEWFEESGPLYRIEVALWKDIATLTIDTSGPGLHKRGYRIEKSSSPLRENLAAAMIMLARWNPHIPLIDPFCGAGTIPIEAALMGRNIAPGMQRNFVSEAWPNISKSFWKEAREEASNSATKDISLYIMGMDSDPRVLKNARKNAHAAGVENDIHFQESSFNKISSRKKYGKIICNPPYGERQGDLQEVEGLYKEMGKIFSELDTWSFYILSPHSKFEQLFGKKATKKRKLYNGNIKVHYYQFFGPAPSTK